MFATPPLDPSTAQAHDWLTQELSKAKYGDQHHLVARFLLWLVKQFDRATNGTASISSTALLVGLGALAVAIGFGLTRVRRDRPQRSDGAAGDGVFEQVARTARELRADARRARDAGDHDTAFLCWFRAIARSGVERVLVPERAGSTAHEVAQTLISSFPEQVAQLTTVAEIFDRIRYGNAHASAADVGLIETLDTTLTRTRPQVAAIPETTP
ncbi:DUF4129 domain-containing protein [Calidifontibacter terrae]